MQLFWFWARLSIVLWIILYIVFAVGFGFAFFDTTGIVQYFGEGYDPADVVSILSGHTEPELWQTLAYSGGLSFGISLIVDAIIAFFYLVAQFFLVVFFPSFLSLSSNHSGGEALF